MRGGRLRKVVAHRGLTVCTFNCGSKEKGLNAGMRCITTTPKLLCAFNFGNKEKGLTGDPSRMQSTSHNIFINLIMNLLDLAVQWLEQSNVLKPSF